MCLNAWTRGDQQLRFVVFNGDTTRAAGLRLEEWTRDQRLVVGSELLSIAYSTGPFSKEAGQTTNGKPCEYLVLSEGWSALPR